MTLARDHETGSIRKTVVVILAIVVVFALAWLAWQNLLPKTVQPIQSPHKSTTTSKKTVPKEAYKGQYVDLDDILSVKVPNGWPAKVTAASDSTKIVLFAGPNELPSLTYNPATAPTISHLDAMGWDGYTQHFYIFVPQTEDTKFAPLTTDQKSTFVLDDGTEGTKYLRIFKAGSSSDEFSALPDGVDEWRGHTYVFTKNDKTVEVHLAIFYPTTLDLDFFESVVKSIKIK